MVTLTTEAQAIRYGEDDAAYVIRTAEAILKVSATFNQSGIACIVDGSMYSPSWRALPHGEIVYQHDYRDPGALEGDLPELSDRYTEALDSIVENWSQDGCSMYWEDGCLWLARSNA